ncbi:hypothetical protein AB0C88_37730 [Streptomyces chartreusis]|uniref:hypothetical protein n=1 Tax=Streptomyces chartreusis TaxID=1969 RepID=UPI0033D935A7
MAVCTTCHQPGITSAEHDCPGPLTLPRETAAALHTLLGQLLDTPVTVTDPEYLRQQLHAAIESEVYEYRERTMFWPETGGVTEEIARLATRGAMEVCARYTAQLRQRLELADGIDQTKEQA